MTIFKVQNWNSHTRDWDGQFTIKPNYKFAQVRRLPFFRLTGMALNLCSAEKDAYKRAVVLAKKLRLGFGPITTDQVRIVRESHWSGTETKHLLWQNGKRLMPLRRTYKG